MTGTSFDKRGEYVVVLDIFVYYVLFAVLK